MLSPTAVARRAPASAALALLGGLVALPCQAALSDTIHPFVAATFMHDDNLLRLEDGQSLSGQRSDNIRYLAAGLSFERPLGRQVFSGSAQASKVTFDHYDQFDYTGKDASLLWKWQFGNRLSGTVGGDYSESLVPFSDSFTSERNLRTKRAKYASAAWRVLADWQVRGRVSQDEYTYALLSQRSLDRTEDVTELGFDYLGANGSTVGLQWTQKKGDYPNPFRFGAISFDPAYTQDQLQLKVLWNFSGVTQLEFLGGHAKREHHVLAERDASGVNGRVSANWQPLGAVRFNASVWREFAAFEGGQASYSLNKGVSAGAIWAATAKLRAEAKYRLERREFPGLVGGASGGGEDRTRGAVLSLTYAARDNIQLVLSGTRDVRTADAGLSNSYKANGVSLSANVQF